MYEEQDPQFSQRAAAALNSAFWQDGAPEGTKAYLAFTERMWARRNLVESACQAARRYEDLTGEAKGAFDEAEAFNAKQGADDDA